MIELFIFIVAGAFTGLSAGLLGIGGGLISVPAMIFLLPYFGVPSPLIMHMAIATSLALIVPTSIISAYSHSRKNAVVWSNVVMLLPGLLLGGGAGAYLVFFIQRETLQSIFAIFIFVIALHMLRAKPKNSIKEKTTSAKGAFFPAVIIGVISSLMGVGGGTMTVPYLVWRGVVLPKAIGTSAMCGLPIAVSASLVFFSFQKGGVSDGEHAYIYLPGLTGLLIGALVFTPIGAMLAHRLNVVLLKRVFIILLLLVSLKIFNVN